MACPSENNVLEKIKEKKQKYQQLRERVLIVCYKHFYLDVITCVHFTPLCPGWCRVATLLSCMYSGCWGSHNSSSSLSSIIPVGVLLSKMPISTDLRFTSWDCACLVLNRTVSVDCTKITDFLHHYW